MKKIVLFSAIISLASLAQAVVTINGAETIAGSVTVQGAEGLNSTFGMSATTWTVRGSTVSLSGVSYYLPSLGGSTGQVLTTSGGTTASTLTWATPSSGGGMTPGNTDYIQVRNTLQSGATFYISSGTISGPFNADTIQATFGVSAATMTVRSATFSVAGITYYFPSTGGSGTQVLTTSGGSSSVNLSWTTPSTGGLTNAAAVHDVAYYSTSPSGDTLDGSNQLTINGTAIAINGDATFGGFIKITSKTLANLASTTPTLVGQIFYCSNCVTDSICTSTQTATASWAGSNRTVACQ